MALEEDTANGIVAIANEATPAIVAFVAEFNIPPLARIDPGSVWAAFKRFMTMR